MEIDPSLIGHPVVIGAIVVILAVLTIWTILRFVARVVAALILIGVLLVGLVVVTGRLTGRAPAEIVSLVVETVTVEATRVVRDLPPIEDFGRLDRLAGATPTPPPRP